MPLTDLYLCPRVASGQPPLQLRLYIEKNSTSREKVVNLGTITTREILIKNIIIIIFNPRHNIRCTFWDCTNTQLMFLTVLGYILLPDHFGFLKIYYIWWAIYLNILFFSEVVGLDVLGSRITPFSVIFLFSMVGFDTLPNYCLLGRIDLSIGKKFSVNPFLVCALS